MKYPRLPRKFNKGKKLTEKQIKDIKFLKRRGMSNKSIAKKFKIFPYAVSYWILSPKERKQLTKRQYETRKGKEDKKEKRKRQLRYFKRKVKIVPLIREYAKKITSQRRKKL